MNNLLDFQPPREGEITLCEVDGRVHSLGYENPDITIFTHSIENHPKIHITRDTIHPAKNMEECKDLFVPVDTPFLKKLVLIYYEHGFKDVLEHLTLHHQVVLSKSARLILNLIDKITSIRIMINPSLRESAPIVMNQLSQTRNWLKNPIRDIAWHPDCMKIAVAVADDSVRIYMHNSHTTPILKCKQQHNVTCIAWRPMSNSDIAVACEAAILVWNVDPHSFVTRPSLNHVIILNRPKHKPVISISWSPRGDILASVAACDSKILLWDVELDRTSSLNSPGTLGYNLLRWSPNGEKLFSSTTSCVFRVWDCITWLNERWNVPEGRVQAACWSPCGTKLVFATNEEPMIYAALFNRSDIVFTANTKNTPNQAVPLYDVTKVEIDGFVAGGIIQSMQWDQRGNHLAVLFHDTNNVAVFSVITEPILQLNPGFLIAGHPEETPNVIAFQPKFEYGTCLTIGWSSGRLQYFPIVYSDFSKTNAPSNLQRSMYETLGFSNHSFYA